MTREELKHEILERLEMVDDQCVIAYWNDNREDTVYKDLDELYDDNFHCFTDALEALQRGFEYSPYYGYYAYCDGEICSSDSIADLIDLDDVAECLLTDMENGCLPYAYGDLEGITEELMPEFKKIRAEEIREQIRFARGRIAELDEERVARVNALCELFMEYEELMI